MYFWGHANEVIVEMNAVNTTPNFTMLVVFVYDTNRYHSGSEKRTSCKMLGMAFPYLV